MKVNSVPDSPSMPLSGKLAIPFIDFRASELQDRRLTDIRRMVCWRAAAAVGRRGRDYILNENEQEDDDM